MKWHMFKYGNLTHRERCGGGTRCEGVTRKLLGRGLSDAQCHRVETAGARAVQEMTRRCACSASTSQTISLESTLQQRCCCCGLLAWGLRTTRARKRVFDGCCRTRKILLSVCFFLFLWFVYDFIICSTWYPNFKRVSETEGKHTVGAGVT